MVRVGKVADKLRDFVEHDVGGVDGGVELRDKLPSLVVEGGG